MSKKGEMQQQYLTEVVAAVHCLVVAICNAGWEGGQRGHEALDALAANQHDGCLETATLRMPHVPCGSQPQPTVTAPHPSLTKVKVERAWDGHRGCAAVAAVVGAVEGGQHFVQQVLE